MTEGQILVLGGGFAGLSAAAALRRGGFDGKVIMITDEPYPPYNRPPLSKETLRGEMEDEKLLLRPESWYEQQGIELVLSTRVSELDPSRHTVGFADGKALGYEKLLLATGAFPRMVDVPGSDLPGVVTLRTLEDARGIRTLVESGGPVVVVGAGFIGAEVAASARELGCAVTMLEIADYPLGRVAGPELGAVFSAIHRDHGVTLETQVGLSRVERSGETLRAYDTKGSAHEAVVVVVGVGLIPEVKLAEEAGIACGNGILVNEFCETSAPDVFAAGDVANHPNPYLKRRVRLEHWQNAQHQGVAAAKAMLGHREAFSEVPWVWSDQYEYNLQMVGYPEPADRVVLRGDPGSADVVAYFLGEHGMSGALGINRAEDVRIAKRIIQAGVCPSDEQLADESTDLESMVG